MDGRTDHRRSFPALALECLEDRLLLSSGLVANLRLVPSPSSPLVLVRDFARHAEPRDHGNVVEVVARVDAKLAAFPQLQGSPSVEEIDQVLDRYPKLESRLLEVREQIEELRASASSIIRREPADTQGRNVSPNPAAAHAPAEPPVVPPALTDAVQPSAPRIDAQRPGSTTLVSLGFVSRNEDEDPAVTLIPPRTVAPIALPGAVEHREAVTGITPVLRLAAATGGPLLENLPLDLAALSQSADAFFARLADLDRAAQGKQWARHLLPCGAALAASALVYAHWRDRKDRRRLGLAGDAGLGPTASLPEEDR